MLLNQSPNDKTPDEVRNQIYRFLMMMLWIVTPVLLVCNLVYFFVAIFAFVRGGSDQLLYSVAGSGSSLLSFGGLTMFVGRVLGYIRSV
ncbi:hypothetical protein OP10G_2831 [Fimbriimonas ginsengisoli Gsoil 348]|uniref:Uncharacterized protein n=1 Tax=Fimbriimonas ginsengisoli Gsoil 348 TaxID=661478 RepID=A0A068NX51_FIMGI|nr:hypothetical protein OP10G_2831 [Fimbriimonas ginsengisoli Gsoil 348]